MQNLVSWLFSLRHSNWNTYIWFMGLIETDLPRGSVSVKLNTACQTFFGLLNWGKVWSSLMSIRISFKAFRAVVRGPLLFLEYSRLYIGIWRLLHNLVVKMVWSLFDFVLNGFWTQSICDFMCHKWSIKCSAVAFLSPLWWAWSSSSTTFVFYDSIIYEKLFLRTVVFNYISTTSWRTNYLTFLWSSFHPNI